MALTLPLAWEKLRQADDGVIVVFVEGTQIGAVQGQVCDADTAAVTDVGEAAVEWEE